MDMMPDGDRYARMPLRRTGRSGLMLPAMSLMINRRPLPEDRVWTEMRRAGCRFHKPSGSGTVKATAWEAAIPLDVAYAKEDLEGRKLTAWTTTRSAAQMPGSWLGPDHPSSDATVRYAAPTNGDWR